MKSLFFLPLCTLCAALVVSPPDDPKTPNLVPRVEQTFENPDNEPQFEDPITKAMTDKAKILKGVGPKEADDRLFDWDETCTDENQRALILESFKNVILMADYAAEHMDKLKASMPEPVQDDKKLNTNNRKFIFDKDPAYAQMFDGQDHRIQYVRDTFGLVSSMMQKKPGDRNGGKPGALRFICDADRKIQYADGSGPYCRKDPEDQASTLGPYDPKYKPTIELKWSFETASSITFCPPFFDAAKFPQVATRLEQPEPHTLDKIDNRERIVLHEYTHLPWVRNFNPQQDNIGYQKAAQVAKSGWAQSKINPDNYAWLAMYAYFNNDSGASGCETDAWPANENKPCKV